METVTGQSLPPMRSRPPVRTAAPARSPRPENPSQIHVLENPLRQHDRALAEAVERELHGLLDDQELGCLEVRFRVCRDDAEGMRFICKVEGAPPADPDLQATQWRWWSPLMEKAEDFRAALRDGLALRRSRMDSSRRALA